MGVLLVCLCPAAAATAGRGPSSAAVARWLGLLSARVECVAPGDSESALELQSWLSSLSLLEYWAPLRDLGVTAFDDLEFVEDADLRAFGMKPVQRRKFRAHADRILRDGPPPPSRASQVGTFPFAVPAHLHPKFHATHDVVVHRMMAMPLADLRPFLRAEGAKDSVIAPESQSLLTALEEAAETLRASADVDMWQLSWGQLMERERERQSTKQAPREEGDDTHGIADGIADVVDDTLEKHRRAALWLRAHRRLHAGDLLAAEKLFQAAERDEHNDGETKATRDYLTAGLDALAEGDYTAAAELLERQMQRAPPDLDAEAADPAFGHMTVPRSPAQTRAHAEAEVRRQHVPVGYWASLYLSWGDGGGEDSRPPGADAHTPPPPPPPPPASPPLPPVEQQFRDGFAHVEAGDYLAGVQAFDRASEMPTATPVLRNAAAHNAAVTRAQLSSQAYVERYRIPRGSSLSGILQFAVERALQLRSPSARSLLFVELGVFTGNSLRRIANVLSSHHASFLPEYKVALHGFDSWQGLPESFAGIMPRGSFATDGFEPPEGLRGVDRLNGIALQLWDGWFNSTVPSFAATAASGDGCQVAFVHVDCDLRSSTIDGLEPLIVSGLVRQGTVLLFDEWLGYPRWEHEGEAPAWHDLAERHGIEWRHRQVYKQRVVVEVVAVRQKKLILL